MPTTATIAESAARVSFLTHPRRVWLRRALFQVHLWAGLIAALYICVIGGTGSILVFQKQLYQLSRPVLFRSLAPIPSDLLPLIPKYLSNAQRAFPDVHFTGLYMPQQDQPTVQLEGESLRPRHFNDYVLVYLDPASGRILGKTGSRFWVATIRELHVRLLSGRTGAVINGCGALCLLAMCITGIVIWWPGLKNWKRALRVDLRRALPRINFDLHSAIGFWTIIFVALWAISGIYFTWPDQFSELVSHLSSTHEAKYPEIHIPAAPDKQPADLLGMVRNARQQSGLSLLAVQLPAGRTSPLAVVLGARSTLDRSTYFFFNPFTGNLIQTWERGPGPTLGTQIIYWLGPLHFGETWGLPVQIIWSLLGLSLPALALTGWMMYWNRYLSKRLRRRQAIGI